MCFIVSDKDTGAAFPLLGHGIILWQISLLSTQTKKLKNEQLYF